ncbi:MAG: RsmB/NOP family class I SAM-dependent RNA methyltransferase [Alphaproteobacteria bacterium]|nr:RsmB/NOP family class I SAM-dependent RNA methyltransferase [Alphaproteobacteria bacterium]
MTPGARMQAVIELLDAIWSGTEPADRQIDAYFRKRRYAGSGDRRGVNETIYDILRHRARLDWWIERTGSDSKPGPRTRLIAELALEKKSSPKDIRKIFSGATHCPQPMTPEEDALAEALYGRPLVHADMTSPVTLEYPDWMDRSLQALWPERLAEEMSALNQPAPVDLRVNTLKTSPDAARKALKDAFIDTEPTALSPIGLRLTGKARLAGTTAFKQGWIEVQDEGSQLVALLTDARPGMDVVDFCAGGGGKALALAASMGVNGRIEGRMTALDISAHRLERMTPRLQRAGAERVRTRIIAARDDAWITKNAGRMDRVLADVPCTGTGAWRRDPNARWRSTLDDLDDMLATQQRILYMAAILVKPGGRLVYTTCSFLQEENERQMAWFLEHHINFRPLPIDRIWAETIGGPPPPPGPSLRLSPASTGTDGFFCAVLENSS